MFKGYFKGFEEKPIHHEGVVNTIFNDINNALNPKWLEVEAEFEERSNVRAKIKKSNL
ncbi:hypothetical protein DRP05_00535 [Archaeoglobales archaeon]|nr:MAG: hypothetical protein DRP05_00535 [Archaeoglobales archaeon]